jgi:translation initiation factor IF-2
MTEDRDFKKVVRERAAKTGESYQTAWRRLEGGPARLSATVRALWQHPSRGLVLGCVVEEGKLVPGMPVTVLAGETVIHEGTVASLRVGKEDRDVVTSGECGITLNPPFHGALSREAEEAARQPFALKPVETVSLPYLVVG